MKTELIKIAIRQNKIFIPKEWITNDYVPEISNTTLMLVANSTKLGFNFSEELLQIINRINPSYKLEILEVLKETTGVNKNWTPLVKQWDIPTGETVLDHVKTFIATIFNMKNGTKLACGHFIPNNSFPLERYNGCPYCGTQFEVNKLELENSNNKLKTLDIWNEENLNSYMDSLLTSPVPLDATQVDSIKILLNSFGLPKNVEIGAKETLMLVIDELIAQEKYKKAGKLFKNANDILRYIWFKNTGYLQIVTPKVIMNRVSKNANNFHFILDKSEQEKAKSKSDLKLKFTRKECKMYASWLNNLELEVEKQCEIMHPKRGVWVRVIRALRLAEYAKKQGYDNLKHLLDVFYNENYEVWQGRVNHFKLKNDEKKTFELLKQRPGLFARSLFSTMLWFGGENTIESFKQIIEKVPTKLIFTLNMYASIYFDKNASRSVKPLGGLNKRIEPNKLLKLYTDEELNKMQLAIKELCTDVVKAKMSLVKNENKTIFIEEQLYNIPIAIGDRNESIQDLPEALMGTKFKVEGEKVRLFLQWGEGLPAQHLDMDLSCSVAYGNKTDFCSYSQLTIAGCKHSGDIQSIPNKVGTAEYIDLDLKKLQNEGAKFVSFTCNAYSNGSLAPNLVVGWMNSKYPMKINSSGVAYDPTAVQHQVRIKKTITKGMLFGVLDVEKREVIWLEMSFGGQIVQNMSFENVEAFITKLNAKLKIGNLLKLKAECQNIEIIDDPEKADEVYDSEWALNSAKVSKLFLN